MSLHVSTVSKTQPPSDLARASSGLEATKQKRPSRGSPWKALFSMSAEPFRVRRPPCCYRASRHGDWSWVVSWTHARPLAALGLRKTIAALSASTPN